MSTLTVHPINEEQEKALKAIFEAFNVKYEKEMDETEYLKASKANQAALNESILNESIQQLDEGKGMVVNINDLWK